MNDLIMPLSITMSTISYILIAKLYYLPAVKNLSLQMAVMPILLFHSFRHIGMAFLMPGVTNVSLNPLFAEPAAYGDLLAGILAFVAIFALLKNWKIATALIWIFNIEGLLDLINAVYQGFTHTVDQGDMGAMYFIPALVVPALIVSHIIVFKLLLTHRKQAKLA